MPKQKYFSKDPNQLSLFDGCDNSQQSEPPSKSPDESEDIESPQPDSLTKSADEPKAVEQLQSATPSESQNSSRDIEPPQPNSPSQSTSRPVDTEGHSKDRLLLFVPDRFDVLERRAKHKHELKTIIVPVEDALAYLDNTYSDMVAAGRGAFWVFRGASGSGKSTFLHTVNLFRQGVESLSIQADEPVPEKLIDLRKSEPVLNKLRVLVVEGREALTDFSVEQLEKDLHSINSFIRSRFGERTLIVWPCNADDLQERLLTLAERIGADSLLGVGEPIYRFNGPPTDQYISIANRTIETLNEGASLVDLGILEERAKELTKQAQTIGKYLGLLRKELLKNEENVEKLLAREKCKMWIVVIAGNNPVQEVAGLSRVRSQADISCLMNSTKSNIVEELKKHPDKVGILGTVLEAKIIYIPIATARSLIINYADNELWEKMKQAEMQTRKDSEATKRLMNSDLAKAFLAEPRGLSGTNRPSSDSRKAFEKLSAIAQKNDELLNRAIGKALQNCGLINNFKTEAEFRGRIKLRSDLLCKTDSGLVRLEFMWKDWAYPGEIANYVLKKLQNYGRAIGLFD
jgi:DNA (cytosine-5)-methyltransferase 1